eukprot:CAMPEP_0202894904 /NCGR_PEP_ID=MMETSP1392-20130828/4204_1 /ASSEMBLY_ACC=CAM_ASM_000868 /TAXON_ID=225041 /ORGANISM="Chlamydomonas chlamydogama, Strain SAG 11-48b" /LENGTH=67 /DNA_ID=CAMNT_0049579741 /DNA_START=611 /DNA_END=814 /DNA_ORIENTATION=+
MQPICAVVIIDDDLVEANCQVECGPFLHLLRIVVDKGGHKTRWGVPGTPINPSMCIHLCAVAAMNSG